jgi:uncharacterized small protein (DUF1192 family)
VINVNVREDLDSLASEVRELSQKIAILKKRYNRLQSGQEKEELREAIKLKQYQALFYIEKIENLSKASKL